MKRLIITKNMYFNVLYFALFTISCTRCQNCPAKGISSHVVLKDGTYRLTTLQRGNFTIQGLVTMTEYGHCDRVSRLGLIGVYAMKYAIDKINNDSKIMPSGKIGLQLDNICFNLTLTMARGIEAVSLHRENSVCRADFLKCDRSQNLSASDVKPVTAIVGTEWSSTSIPLASLLSLYHIPQISFAASSRLLSKKDLYKSFFRTIPSDTNQIAVMLEIIEKFKWNYVFAIGSDDDYGKLGISELKQNAQGRNICVAHDEYIPQGTKENQKIDEIMTKLQAEKSAKVVILFCYHWMGQKILTKAKALGINRIWVTSESFNPEATSFSKDIVNQTVGLLTVSLKRYEMPYLINYMEEEIKKNFNCDMWLQNMLKTQYNCSPTRLTQDRLSFQGNGAGCPLKIADIIKVLKGNIQGTVYNLVDAVTALGHGISMYLNKTCLDLRNCHVRKIPPKELTKEMYKVHFVNELDMTVAFNVQGDPKYAFYTIENIQLDTDGSYKYVAVGDWDEKKTINKLQLDGNKIQWPLWFKPDKAAVQKAPMSRCTADCQPGQLMVGKQECCWACQPCDDGTYSTKVNAVKCKPCPDGYHTTDKITCVKTETKWLIIEDAPGMAIIIISCVGLLIIALAMGVLIQFRGLLDDTSSPHVITTCCFLVALTFGYGVLHVIKPTQQLCQAVNALFYLFLMFYTAIVMIKTKFFTRYLMDHWQKWLRNSLLIAQLLSLLVFLVIEAASIVAWFYIDSEQVMTIEITTNDVFEKRLQCQVAPTAARYVSTFIPIIILIIATFCAFRERNMEHAYFETKFLSFTCIALCIIIVAYMPTFHYVVGKYKSIVMAITMDLFGFTYMGCLIFPKVYIAIMRYKRGEKPIKTPVVPVDDSDKNGSRKTSGVNNYQVDNGGTRQQFELTAVDNMQYNKKQNNDNAVVNTDVDDLPPAAVISSNGHVVERKELDKND